MTAETHKPVLLVLLVLVLLYVSTLRTAPRWVPRAQAAATDSGDERWIHQRVNYETVSMGVPDLGCWQAFWTRMAND
jgi:hypothetical protein